jgi:hypothetical protein
MEARMTLGYLSQGCHAILLLKSTSSNLVQPKTFDLLSIGLIKSHSFVTIITCVRMEERTWYLRGTVWSEVAAGTLDASAWSTYYVCQQVAGHATKGAPRQPFKTVTTANQGNYEVD